MAEDTSLLQEIDEALRADTLQHILTRHGKAILAFCALVVLTSIVSVVWRNHLRETHTEMTSLLLKGNALAKDKKYDEAIGVYEKTEAGGGALATLAALRHAETLIALQHEDKALALYNDVAAGKYGEAPDVLRDFAALEADIIAHNQALASGKPPVPTEGANAAQGSGRVFSRSFAEPGALRALSSGDSKSAETALNGILNDETTAYTTRMRVAETLDVIGENKK